MQKTQLMNNMRKCLKERKNKKITNKAEDLAPFVFIIKSGKIIFILTYLFIKARWQQFIHETKILVVFVFYI